MNCPVCGNRIQVCGCGFCGFDISVWREEYPTLAAASSGVGISVARKKLSGFARTAEAQFGELSRLRMEYEAVTNQNAVLRQTVKNMSAELKKLRSSENIPKTAYHTISKLEKQCKAKDEKIRSMETEIKKLSDVLSREIYKHE